MVTRKRHRFTTLIHAGMRKERGHRLILFVQTTILNNNIYSLSVRDNLQSVFFLAVRSSSIGDTWRWRRQSFIISREQLERLRCIKTSVVCQYAVYRQCVLTVRSTPRTSATASLVNNNYYITACWLCLLDNDRLENNELADVLCESQQ